MHDAGPRHAADAGEAVAAMGDQRIDESALRVAGAGMHHEAGGLVDDDQRVVLVDDVERDRFARERLGVAGGRSSAKRSPGLTRYFTSSMVAPPKLAWPCLIKACTRVRLKLGRSSERKRSSRSPAWL